MILFWLICAAFVAIALAFVVPPLMATARKEHEAESKEANLEVYRDQIQELEADLQNGIIAKEEFERDRDEIERRLLSDVAVSSNESTEKVAAVSGARGPVYAIALALPVAALAFYFQVGTPAALNRSATNPVSMPPTSNAQREAPRAPMSQGDIEANVASLAKRMEENPNDAAGWAMLGRSYVTLKKFNEAANAYGKAAALKPNDADILADYAFATGMVNNKSLLGPAAELIKKALAIDPDNAKALELAGSAAFEQKNFKEAISYWERLLQRTPKDSELAQALTERIELAKTAEAAGK